MAAGVNLRRAFFCLFALHEHDLERSVWNLAFLARSQARQGYRRELLALLGGRREHSWFAWIPKEVDLDHFWTFFFLNIPYKAQPAFTPFSAIFTFIHYFFFLICLSRLLFFGTFTPYFPTVHRSIYSTRERAGFGGTRLLGPYPREEVDGRILTHKDAYLCFTFLGHLFAG